MELLKPGSAGSIPVYSTNSIPDFVCEQHIPVAFAKFLHSTMPYTDPTTKARYEWTQMWTQMFDNYVPTTLPAFSGPCINTQASASNDVWNRSAFNNSILRQASTVNVGANNEMYWGVNPNTETLTVDVVYQQAAAISTYFQTVGNCVPLAKIPKVAYDGTFYSFVNSAQSLFPGIFSSTSYVDVEFSYVFHVPINPNAGVSQQQQSFAYNTEIPSVLNEIAPTALGGLLAPAQAQMVLNYAYILRACPWHIGGRRELLKGMHKVYPGLRSVKPNYSSLDLNNYHQIVEDCLYTVLDNYANRASTAGDARTLADVSALLTVFECALFARVASFSWPSFVLYTTGDVASLSAVDGNFRTVMLPPILADYISGVKETVINGQLYMPLVDMRPASSFPGVTKFFGLPIATDYASGRWFNRLSATDTDATLLGVTFLEMYTPTNAVPSSTAPPTSLNRQQPFATGILTSGGNTSVQWGGASNLLSITPLNILGGFTSPIVPAPTSRYIGSTPLRYFQFLMASYNSLFTNGNTSYFPPMDADLGIFANVTPSVIENRPLVPALALKLAPGSTMLCQLQTIPTMVGSNFPLDAASIGRACTFGYKTAQSVNQMPYVSTLASTASPITALIADTMQISAFNTWDVQFQARVQTGLPELYAARSIFEPIYAKIATNISTDNYRVGDAVALINKITHNISYAPYNQSKNLESFNSPNLMNAGAMMAFGNKKMAPYVPFISPITQFLHDVVGLF